MKSPFPGMDPYLEARWSDVHVKLIAFLGEAIQAMLPVGLRARAEERVLLEEDFGGARDYRADVVIVDSGRRSAAPVVTGTTATLEPVYVELFEHPLVDRFLQIIDGTNGNRVITAVEVLSPGNKTSGRLNFDYLRKLADYARGEVSVVEIDLLRSGRARMPFAQSDLPPERRTPYLVSLRRAAEMQRWEVYPIRLNDALPVIPIPLRRGDADLMLPLQPLIERVYTAGGHDDIDYAKPPEPPLSKDEAAWAAQLVHQDGRNDGGGE